MYKHNTFGEILKLLNKDIITKAVFTHKSDKYSRGFNILFCFEELATQNFGISVPHVLMYAPVLDPYFTFQFFQSFEYTQSQLVAMLFGQLSKCKSLRDLSIRFNAKS